MDSTPLFPLGMTLFPAGVLHLRIFEVRYLDMVKKCIANDTQFGVVALLSGSEVRTPTSHETFASAGTLAKITECAMPIPGLFQLSCIGTSRFYVENSQQQQYGLWTAQTTPIADDAIVPVPETLQASANALGQLIARLQKDGVPRQAMPIEPPFRLDESGWVADRWCELLPMAPGQKQSLLMLQDPVQRLERVQAMLDSQNLLP